jgi:uncharacterized protein (TIGR02687 family)
VKRIHDSLARVLARHRLVFWYDGAGEWEETFESFSEESVVKLRVAGDEFATKVRIARRPEDRFLVYVPAARPADTDNWLLDLVLQGHEYHADKVSIGLEEAGLSHDFRDLGDAHAPFFNSAKRIHALRERLAPADQPRDVRLKMMGVLAGAEADVDALLLEFLNRAADTEAEDPVAATLTGARLVEPFWREVERLFGYAPAQPGLRDFAVTLFRGANPLDGQVGLHPHARVFLQRWKDSQAYFESYRWWATRLEEELQVAGALAGVQELERVGTSDAFEVFERFTVHGLVQAFQRGTSAAELRASIQQRRGSFWRASHAHGYEALEQAVALRELLDGADLSVESIDAGLRRYTTSWWRIDAVYRRFHYHLRRYTQRQVLETVRDWVEAHYVNDYLLPLADRWGDHVRKLARWDSGASGLPLQRRFFDTWVEPFRSRNQKVVVIVSDALRYEAAAEFGERLRSANRWSAEVEATLGALPSYTQLGMASLLPGRTWSVDATGAAAVDGRSAAGTANRGEILAAACGGKATAIQAEAFLELNSKTDGRELVRDHEVVYVYHNAIDHVGDKRDTEAQTTDAVARAFDELDALVRRAATYGWNNILLTADHGFLFQQDPVDEGDMTALPEAGEWTSVSRRYALGRDLRPSPGVALFSAAALGLDGDWTAAFPTSLGRFPVKGSGKRYVHGGISLQEVVVPVVRIHRNRVDDTGMVEVDILRIPAKVTTGQLSVALFQDRAAVGKVRPRKLRVGLWAKDGTPISEQRTLTFESQEEEARFREVSLVLVLSGTADRYNNRDVELRLEGMVDGTSQWVTYRSHDLKLQKPFTSDFDDI